MDGQNSPLVSVLIPTFNRVHFFRLALKSVLQQTYNNIEIVITDNSTNNDTYNFIQPYLRLYPFIKYYRNPKNIGPVLNFIKAYELSCGEFINILMDDDLFHPHRIEKMIPYLINDKNKEITLVTSHRSFIDKNGARLPDTKWNKKKSETVMILNGKNAGDPIISEFNWIGVPSTTLFRREALSDEDVYGTFSGRLFRCGVDCAAWLTLLSKGKMVYLPEILSYVRIHDGEASKDPNMLMHALMDWMHMLFHSRKNGFLVDDAEFSKAINTVEEFINIVKGLPLKKSQQKEITYYQQCLNILKINKDV